MKNVISYAEWLHLEEMLMQFNVGYQVLFDNHNGAVEMIIEPNKISVYRWEGMNSDNEEGA